MEGTEPSYSYVFTFMHANDFSKDALWRILASITIAFGGKLKFKVKEMKKVFKNFLNCIFKLRKFLAPVLLNVLEMQKFLHQFYLMF